MADDDSNPKRTQRFKTLERIGAQPREIMPTLPGDAPPRPTSRARRIWKTLIDIRRVSGATTQELNAVNPEDDDPPILPMKSSHVPTLITLGISILVAIIIAFSR